MGVGNGINSRELKDFADTAAALTHLDLVISVDTSVVHLAGAMGCPVWVLLPRSPDWRWMLDWEENPWYPGVARLFRQRRPMEWEGAIEQLKDALVTWQDGR